MSEEIKDILNILKKAGNKILEIYKRDYQIKEKKDKSLVTEADLESEKIILNGLKKYRYKIISEEKDDKINILNDEKIWIIDPLDGTQDFLNKTGEFSIMVGLIDKGEPVLGIVYLPEKDITYFAEKGKGAYLKKGNNSPIKLKVSNVSDLKNSRFGVSRFHLDQKTKNIIENNLIKETKSMGSIGIKLGAIAENKVDVYLTFSDRICKWDTCAPEVILKEAGGTITDLKGEKLLYIGKEIRNLKGILATNGILHKKLKHIIQNT
ncbi:MAG: 3'(2'),5'-bisphosphate nucleotidase CysQ [Candidatus Nealsonbacteria bacterium]